MAQGERTNSRTVSKKNLSLGIIIIYIIYIYIIYIIIKVCRTQLNKLFNCSFACKHYTYKTGKFSLHPPELFASKNRALQITLAQQFCKKQRLAPATPPNPLFFFALRLQTTSAEELPHELPPSPIASIFRSERVAS